MGTKVSGRRYAIDRTIPVISPGLVVGSLIKDDLAMFVTSMVLLGYSAYVLVRDIKLLRSVESMLKYHLISAVLFLVCAVLLIVTPESNNALGGVILFVFVPSMFIVTHLMISSAPAKELRRRMNDS